MPSFSDASTVVTLKGGTVATVAAITLLLDLERRGIRLTPVDGGRLRVQPHAHLTPEDRDAIRLHRDELLALVHYCDTPPEVM
jgi:hypothetical protein